MAGELPQTLDGYELSVVLRRVGAATVVRARDPRMGREVVVKLVASDATADGRERHERELKLLASLRHPALSRVLAWGRTPEHHYLVLEPEEGELLSARLARAGPLAAEAVVELGVALCGALSALHERELVHRDLRPAGVLFGPTGAVRLVDLGFAKVEGDTALTDARALVGTPRYLAPEVLAGREATAASDLYQLGLVLYEAASGQPAFPGADPADIVRRILLGDWTPLSTAAPEVPQGLERTIHRCLAEQPAARPADAAALADALTRSLDAPRVPAPVELKRSSGTRRPRRARSPLTRLVPGALALGAGLAVVIALVAPRTPSVPLDSPPAPVPSTSPTASVAAAPPPAPEVAAFRAALASADRALSEVHRGQANPLWAKAGADEPALTAALATALERLEALVPAGGVAAALRLAALEDLLNLARYTGPNARIWAPLLPRLRRLVAAARDLDPGGFTLRASFAHFLARMEHDQALRDEGRRELEACLKLHRSAGVLTALAGLDRDESRYDLLLSHAQQLIELYRTAPASRSLTATARAQEVVALHELKRRDDARAALVRFDHDFPDKHARVDADVRLELAR